MRATAHLNRRRAATVGVAVVVSAAIWIVAVPLLGLNLLVSQFGGRPALSIGLPAVILTCLVACLAGWGLLAILERRTDRAGRIWTIAATVAFVLSLTPLVFGPDTATSTGIALGVMHLAVAAVLIPLLPRRPTSSSGVTRTDTHTDPPNSI